MQLIRQGGTLRRKHWKNHLWKIHVEILGRNLDGQNVCRGVGSVLFRDRRHQGEGVEELGDLARRHVRAIVGTFRTAEWKFNAAEKISTKRDERAISNGLPTSLQKQWGKD